MSRIAFSWEPIYGFRSIRHGDKVVTLMNKPQMGFVYDAIMFFKDGEAFSCIVSVDGEQREFDSTSSEAIEIEAFILRQGLDQFGEDVMVHAVDATGQYVGKVLESSLRDGFTRVPSEPPGVNYRWMVGQWVRVPTLEEAIAEAIKEIDIAAGAARLRYITDVPGQQGVYLVKAEQSEAYLADPSGPVPPYVAAEAEAMGATPEQAAQYILATRDAWQNTVGPAIEKARRIGKIAVEASTSLEVVNTRLDEALDNLNLI